MLLERYPRRKILNERPQAQNDVRNEVDPLGGSEVDEVLTSSLPHIEDTQVGSDVDANRPKELLRAKDKHGPRHSKTQLTEIPANLATQTQAASAVSTSSMVSTRSLRSR